MFLLSAVSLSAMIAASVTVAQIAPNIYRINNVDTPQIVASQAGPDVEGLGGNGGTGQTWFISPTTAGGQITIQNVQSRQYMSVSGTPASGSPVVGSSTPFPWTLTFSGFGIVNDSSSLVVTAFAGRNLSLTLTPGPPETRAQQWTINAIVPFPSTYRLGNTVTNAFLTASSSSPGSLSNSPSNPGNALQLWSLSGTGPGSSSGTLMNLKTGAFLAVSNGTLGTFPNSQQWSLNVGGAGDSLTSTVPSPNVLAIDPAGQVILDANNAGNQHTWTFVPADPSIAS